MRIAIVYEHADWFQPLFDELERRQLPYDRLLATSLAWDPAPPPAFDLLVNRMSPSAYLRGHERGIHTTAAFLEYVESHGIPVVNGSSAYRLEISKAAQLDLFRRVGVPHPRTRVINDPAAAHQVAEALRFPVVVKPNIGGSGAGIVRFDSPDDLARAAKRGTIDLGIDATGLVQELLESVDGSITRVEVLDGQLLYAIKITPPAGHGFNLCPADICQTEVLLPIETPAGQPLVGLCADKPAMRIEATTVDAKTASQAVALARAAGVDVGGVEFLTDPRDGEAVFYDVNALSNFVTDAPRIVGFDPVERLVDYLEGRLRGVAARPPLPAAAASALLSLAG